MTSCASSTEEKLDHRSRGLQELRNANFIFAVWLLYFTGAVCGTFLQLRWSLHALFVPILLLFIAIASDQVRPLSSRKNGTSQSDERLPVVLIRHRTGAESGQCGRQR